MDIRYKLFPYPVLSFFSDDYSDSSFDVAIELLKDGYNLRIDFMATLKNLQLMELINNGKAQFVYHLECAQTGYRKAIQTPKKEECFTISNKDVCGRLQICPFIVATDNITDYTNNCFHEDYSGMKFGIEAGCIMAVGKQINAEISKDVDDLSNVPSIFAIILNTDNSQKQMLVDIDQTKILIKVPLEDYYNYKALNNSVPMQSVLNSLVVIPALIYTLEEVKSRPSGERYLLESFGWYHTIRKVLRMQFDCDIETDAFDTQNMLQLAQKLINDPLHDALKVMASSSENGEEAAA